MLEVMLVSALLFFLYYMNKMPSTLPPGIKGWPFFGSLPSQNVSMVEQVRDLRKKYGDIFTWRIGGRLYIFLCKYEYIKAALNRLEVSNRPELFTLDLFTNSVKAGFINASGKLWQNNRRFAIRHLKNLGMGKTTYESVILHEVAMLVKDLEGREGDPKPLPFSINIAVLNVIWRICADRRYNVDDEEAQHFHGIIDKAFGDVDVVLILYDLIPWLPKIVPNFISNWLGVAKLKSAYNKLKVILKEVVEEHVAVLDPENPRDYIDYYLIEMEAQKNNPETTMNDLDLQVSLADLFVAGSETTSSTLRWSIFYLAKYPEIQAKVHKELDTVVGKDICPSLKHKESLPYLDAVSLEVQRVVSLVALSIPHVTSAETLLGGYIVPKGAVVIPSLECCHSDPVYWEKPNDFYPEHFLNKEGKVIHKKEGFIPFSTGKRVCPGESLACMEIYLFLSGMLQKFQFTLPEGEDLNPKRNPKDRFINAAKPFNVIIKKRH